jgi:hypothetical protein
VNKPFSRNQTLRSVSRKNWAQAVRGLHRAETDLTQIEAELEQTRRDIVSLQSALESRPALGWTRASRLQMDAVARERKRAQLGHFEAREQDLVKKVAQAAGRVDDAKKEVSKAHKALNA